MIKYKTFIFFILSILYLSCQNQENVDLLLYNGIIWTGEKDLAWADWISIYDNRIAGLGVGNAYPSSKNSIDLKNNLVVPGFNDSHVHFASAGNLLLGINLLDVNSDEILIKRVKETIARLPEGSWITGGDWGAYEAWNMGSEGEKSKRKTYTPSRSLIDSFTGKYPILINKYDRKLGLANQAALDYLGIMSDDGILNEGQLKEALSKVPEKSFERKKAESRRALQQCREKGVTTVQDMSPHDRIEVYNHLKDNGELTCRINFSPSRLLEYKNMIKKNWVIDRSDPTNPEPFGDDWISFGTLKTHIDGIMGARTARFYEAYSDNAEDQQDWKGGWREFSEDMDSFREMILAADKAGIQLRIHAIGDEANAILLDILDEMDDINGVLDRRFRVVHAQVIADRDFERYRGRKVVAEVQPYHVTDDMRWMEERIGHDRCKGAYSFKRLKDNGCILSFGSDWPGTNASYYPINPIYGLYAAVTRQTVNGKPDAGWFPEEKISLEEALTAYTWGSSYGAYEEDKKGTLKQGKLADITVLDTNLFETEPANWLETKVLYTIVDGKIVYSRD